MPPYIGIFLSPIRDSSVAQALTVGLMLLGGLDLGFQPLYVAVATALALMEVASSLSEQRCLQPALAPYSTRSYISKSMAPVSS